MFFMREKKRWRIFVYEYRCLFSFIMNFFAESGKNIYCFSKALEKILNI